MTSKEQILSALQNLCVRREYCTSDIRRKALDRCEGNAALADELVASLKADRFVDDVRYASAFAREKAALTGWGPVKIRFALRAKGIADSDIAAGLSEIEEDRAASRLESLLRNKWKILSDDPAGRLKLIRFALSRGYEYSQVEGIVDEITRQ